MDLARRPARPARSADTAVSLDLVRTVDMSLTAAEALLAAVQDEARYRGVALGATVVDRGGNVVASMRMDGAQLGALSLATDKAVTAASFGHPTGAWAASSIPGESDWGLAGTLGGRAIVFPGGVPVFAGGELGGELVGALGVSGAASDVDEACGEAAVAVIGLRSAAP